MPSDDLRARTDASDLPRVPSPRRTSETFAQALPTSLRRLFGAAEPRSRFPPELAFLVAEGIAPDRLDPAARIAAETGVTGEAVLFGQGLSDDLYYRLLARHLGALYLEKPLTLSAETDVAAAVSTGAAPLAPNRLGLRRLHAPRGDKLRLLLRQHRVTDRRGTAFAITTPRRFDAMLRRHEGAASLERAADGLADWDASLSARGGPATRQIRVALLLTVMMAFGLGASPDRAVVAASLALFPLFAAAVAQRLLVVWAGRSAPATAPDRIPDRDLPVYTLLVPLFREARVLPQLVRALDALDYPPAKRDIKLLLESHDRETVAAAARMNLPDRYAVMVLGDGHPRTKPRALNAGLAWARGDYVVVYDAEDRPDPGQLRSAVRRFADAPARLACLQARLVIDHADETWITRLFALEYAALFGVVKPGLAALGLPVPLGGTSNHFRIAALRRVGGWDAWNVTEDIDLGFRLARFGFAVGALDSWTAEEAPLTFARWLPQRARWLKGWMVTLVVCARDPGRLLRELGWRRALSVLISLGATVASTLVGPQLALLALVELARGTSFDAAPPLRMACEAAWIALLVAGAAALLWPAIAGLRRLGRLDLTPWLMVLPVYLVLTSIAAWRALDEVWRDPQRWNKTEHGLAAKRATPPCGSARRPSSVTERRQKGLDRRTSGPSRR